ncbi:trichohyalin-like [Planococcus citri]|uniref:trichohyalin-like n=1 Tax=Planococcus citri TaxID=170843 RepID=UPI0031F8C9BB
MTEAKVLVDIDNFLEEHRKKLQEDRKVLNEILDFLDKKQQALVLDNGSYLQDSSLDETDRKSPDCVENHTFELPDHYKDEQPRVMVRYGEFSPLNPVFRSSSRPLLGLGEYEERRKIFLEKKKREYQQYLSKAKNEKEREKAKSKLPDNNKNDENHPRLTNIAEADSAKVSPRKLNMPREVLSPGRGIVEAVDPCYARWQQQVYRRELDRQIIDKKKRMKAEKERERLECEKKQKEMMMEQLKLAKSITDQIRRYQMTEMFEDDESAIDEKENQTVDHENQIFIEGVNLSEAPSTPVCSLGFNPVPMVLESPPHQITSSIFNTASPPKSPQQVPLQLTSSIFNRASDHSRKPTPFHVDILSKDEVDSSRFNSIPESTTETKIESSDRRKSNAITNGSNTEPERLLRQKSQQEIYKNELARQIEEKKRLEMERKRKEAEEEKKIDAKVKMEEEKLRQEYEREQAEREYRASQRVQQEIRLQEQLTRLQKEAEERKKNVYQPSNAFVASKPAIYPTNHGVTQKGAMRNVSFAPKACVYSFQNTDNGVQSNQITSTENRTKDNSQIIVEAPYVLAVKGNEVQNGDLSYKNGRPRSPPVPALRTQEILSKSLPVSDCVIPSTVSMSPEARERFLKDAKILSNLSEIRRRLLIKHAGLDGK